MENGMNYHYLVYLIISWAMGIRVRRGRNGKENYRTTF